ncbi:MAG: flagellar brake protein [Methylococcaceae bacterium]|jgi:c-di-GMP-binding flagellar brake protein YcgR|uniref:flagellar brake protein n=1 Tax=Methylicorpusculum sp. TaxID=2713644 RepID=UPI0027261AB6|nr:flagellar regulator YcgR PilZN domain-containing protein [Methylicorpusculum sp.]MDO9161289.1 flagellar brake protein [Methylococcaceae bacterium]MDZ4156978.1 flagellar regulator YcgR PilZN domain-containing protein [Methylococcales bacterium]MDP2392697.1 flagellar brake protein [Methylococcaceae bacterium]MDP3018562.1 flagellar brake protein [Methylococcaceae bacterium]MDP3391317.1 flagellar brake protein [Methylococcaceae bacterium]
MLNVIRKFFAKKDLVDESLTPNNTDNPRENPSFVTNPDKIFHLLQQLIIEPPRCTITLNNSDSLFLTDILEVDPDFISFSPLTPSSGNQLLASQRALKLSTVLGGIPLTFNLQNICVDKSADPICLKAALPEKIYYPQRRLTKRMPTNSTTIEFKGTSRDTGVSIQGYVTDISRGGLSVIYNSTRGNIIRSDRLSYCSVVLPDNQTIAFELTVSSSKKPLLGSNKRHLGGQFENIYPQDEKKLDRYLSTLERQQLRKRRD